MRREQRLAALKQARQVIEARAKEKAAAQTESYQAKIAARQGAGPAARSGRFQGAIQLHRSGEPAYNPQAAVDEAMLIVGERVSDAPNDQQELVASVAAIRPVVAEVRAVLVDSGIYRAAAVATVEQKPDGTARGLTVFAAVEKTPHHKSMADFRPQPDPPAPGPGATAKERMAHRLKTALGQARYRLRKQTVEPVFGMIKEVMGFRRFTLRGRAKVALEWTLVCVSYNLKRMFALKNLAGAG